MPLRIEHPLWMMLFLVLTSVTFSLFGFIIGIWADGFEKLQLIPLLIITPLTFLGGSFYSIDMLPPFWQTVTLFNPVVYLISGFRWSFYGIADVSVGVSLGHDRGVPGDLAGDRGVDLQDGVPAEDIARGGGKSCCVRLIIWLVVLSFQLRWSHAKMHAGHVLSCLGVAFALGTSGFVVNPQVARAAETKIGKPASDASQVRRGRYMIVTNNCNDCHTPGYPQRTARCRSANGSSEAALWDSRGRGARLMHPICD